MHEQDTGSNPDGTSHIGRATFGDVFAVGEFRVLWICQVLSVLGDQLARVALTLLVYDRTHSPLLAAVTFAASVVPTFVGGVALAGLADRLPRRRVMITCDLARAVGVLAMAVPGVPLAALVALLFTVTMIGTPFTSARAAVYPEILSADRYVLGSAVTLTTYQLAQVIGFAAGGAIVGFVGVRTSLLADAATFAASALFIRIWVGERPASRPPQEDGPSHLADLIGGVRLVFARPGLRTPMLLGWLAAFYNAPEGVAAPLAQSLHAGTAAVGLILAAAALGASVGAVAFSRLVRPSARLSWMRPLAIASCAVLTLFALRPGLPLTLAILFCSGVFDCFQVAASAAFVTTAPVAHRSQAFGLAQAGMSLGQGTAMILAGAAAEHFASATVIAVAGALGTVTAVAVAASGPSRQQQAPVSLCAELMDQPGSQDLTCQASDRLS
ncbi:MAG: MFS transporter [Streptosporangiaceae bacterium]|jgi:MFS family permease